MISNLENNYIGIENDKFTKFINLIDEKITHLFYIVYS